MAFPHLNPDQAMPSSQPVKSPTFTPTLAQRRSKVSHIGAGEPQRIEGNTWQILLCQGGIQQQTSSSKTSLSAKTTAKDEKGLGKQVPSSALLWEKERSAFFLLPFFSNISTHSLRQSKAERKENSPAMCSLSPWKRQCSLAPSWSPTLIQVRLHFF